MYPRYRSRSAGEAARGLGDLKFLAPGPPRLRRAQLLGRAVARRLVAERPDREQAVGLRPPQHALPAGG